MLPVLAAPPLAGEPMLLGDEAGAFGALAAFGCLAGEDWTDFWALSCSDA